MIVIQKALRSTDTRIFAVGCKLCAKYKKFGLPVSDLIQEANVGLMQAADKFDPIATFASKHTPLGGSKPPFKNISCETGQWFA